MTAITVRDITPTDTRCQNAGLQARAWTSVPGKERVYLSQATGPAARRFKDAGHVSADGNLIGVPAHVARLIENLVASMVAPSAPVPTHADPAFHAAVRRGEAALAGTEQDLLDAVDRGYVSVDDAMNQDF